MCQRTDSVYDRENYYSRMLVGTYALNEIGIWSKSKGKVSVNAARADSGGPQRLFLHEHGL